VGLAPRAFDEQAVRAPVGTAPDLTGLRVRGRGADPEPIESDRVGYTLMQRIVREHHRPIADGRVEEVAVDCETPTGLVPTVEAHEIEVRVRGRVLPHDGVKIVDAPHRGPIPEAWVECRDREVVVCIDEAGHQGGAREVHVLRVGIRSRELDLSGRRDAAVADRDHGRSVRTRVHRDDGPATEHRLRHGGAQDPS
jgi:hypothetical protein